MEGEWEERKRRNESATIHRSSYRDGKREEREEREGA